MGEDRVAAVLPAAGSGSRLGGERKQYRVLGDQPLFIQTLRVFDAHPGIDFLVLAVQAEDLDPVRAALDAVTWRCPVVATEGGASRQASVAGALAALPETVGWVLVHDAVRPFVTADLIDAAIGAMRRHGAAALAVPVTDTVRRVAGGRFGEQVPRAGLYGMQTPQGARRSWLVEAHAAAVREGFEATDDVALLQRAGHPVAFVEGSSLNFKVTSAADWELARAWWPHRASSSIQTKG
jgi:2-C-methyl-D-erythritol 4-phosphate cytidylyltransferase